ncbi:MAG: group III truncated hemoglobin [Nibricoccus sp.]
MSSAPATLFERIGGRPGLQTLLRRFYADVRQHNEIGPIFAAHIDDWPKHMEKIADFWSGLTGGPALYGGGFAGRHMPLQLEERHFQAWLGLWHRHCQTHLPAAEATDMIAIAEALGQRLRMVTGANRRT